MIVLVALLVQAGQNCCVPAQAPGWSDPKVIVTILAMCLACFWALRAPWIKQKAEANLIIENVYREAAVQYEELVGRLHTHNMDPVTTLSAPFNGFKPQRKYYDKLTEDAYFFRRKDLKALVKVNAAYEELAQSLEGRYAAGDDFAERVRAAVFVVEDRYSAPGFDRKRFRRFLDPRLARLLVEHKTTDVDWRTH